MRVSNDRKYVCGHRLYTCITTQKSKGCDSREITSLPEIKKVIYMNIISIVAVPKINHILITRLI